MPITIHSGPGDTMPGRDDEPDLVQMVIARLGSHFRGRWDHEALDAAATDVLDELAHAAGDFHTPTPSQIDKLVAAVRARGEAGAA
ncbi:hypothetical protein [Amycolatopsis sp. TNS106]|uniref:hypothetical protein n=1 Tax=Amycolatopsis sp. TNS106 TaxID=2861750 RepID=UPI001C56C90D|nr:hypothetical protein [Amycolatopsis sp. TNS106]QXV63584.1 hypothetical protein CVV72_41230 [Amycolatopsis sp. TNS106]